MNSITSRLLYIRNHFDLTQIKVFMILPVISDVDKVPKVSLALIAVKHHPRLPEHALKLLAVLLKSVAAVQ